MRTSVRLLPSVTTVRCLATALCLAALVGCGPRGESRKLDEIFADARASYMTAAPRAEAGVKQTLEALTAELERLSGLKAGGDAREVSEQAADLIAVLTSKAGYTQRPSLAELAAQYRAVSEGSDVPMALGSPRLKLLVARTYQLLASEIKTTNFRL